MKYRRSKISGACYFFTVNLSHRQERFLVERVGLLRSVFRNVRRNHPFRIDAIVILPDHLHTIWTLPEDDNDYPKRWSLIKSSFSRALPKTEKISQSRSNKRERGIWQRRYWEHQIRNDEDFECHVDYIHINPVKHGYVDSPSNWPYSSFHAYVREGKLSSNWAANEDIDGWFGE